MYERLHHRLVERVLLSLDDVLLARRRCYFGGGTAIALAHGSSRPEIARRLGLSPHTVATISKRIYAKLGVRRRAELANRLGALSRL